MTQSATEPVDPLLAETLAERFAPVLVLYPELTREAEDKQKQFDDAGIKLLRSKPILAFLLSPFIAKDDETNYDFHPRDIRMVLSKVGEAEAYEGKGVWDIVPGIARQIPTMILVLALVVGTFWLSVGMYFAKTGSDALLHGTGGVLTAFYAPPLVIVTLFTIYAFRYASTEVGRNRVVGGFAVAAVIVGVETAIALSHFSSDEISKYSVVVGLLFFLNEDAMIGLSALSAITLSYIALAFLMVRPFAAIEATNPSAVLTSITNQARRRAGRAKRRFLLYAGLGPPRKRESYRSAYRELLRTPAAKVSRIDNAVVKLIKSLTPFLKDRKPDPTEDWGQEKTDPEMTTRRSGPRDPAIMWPRTAYARVARGTRRFASFVVIQYWLAYLYNDWDNTHEMDWEQVSVYLRLQKGETDANEAEPMECAFSAHFGGTVAPWEEVIEPEKVIVVKCVSGDKEMALGKHPIVHVAHGSHANYPTPGLHQPFTRIGGLKLTTKDLAFIRGGRGSVDYTADIETGDLALPRVICIPAPFDNKRPARFDSITWEHCDENKHDCQDNPDNSDHKCPNARNPCQEPCDQHHKCLYDTYRLCRFDFRWLNLKGKWGSPGGIIGGAAAPLSPPMQAAWEDPFEWLVSSCERVSNEPANPERILHGFPEVVEARQIAGSPPLGGRGPYEGDGVYPTPLRRRRVRKLRTPPPRPPQQPRG
jgi:hypothetical protein